MQTIPLEWAESHLTEIVEKLTPDEEIILTRNNTSVAVLRAAPTEQARPIPGRGKGMLTILSEDEEHLKDFAEYMP